VADHAMACLCTCTPAVNSTPAWRRIGLGILADYVPAAVIDEVLAETGRVQRRVRRLPARVTVLFILALTLFSGQGYRGVWRQLTHSSGEAAGAPSTSALTQARRRLGVAPLAALFARLRGTQATEASVGAFTAGLRLVSWDATMLDVADSEANAAAFIRPRNRKGAGAFPKVRLMTLIETGTHAVIDAVFGPDSEQVLAGQLLDSLTEGMLLLGDRNFPSWRLWGQAAATGAHLLWRVKTNLLLPRIGTFTDGSWLAVLPKPRTGRRQGHWVRVIEYTVTVTATCPATGTVTTRTELFRLITTITDPNLASAADLAACYRQR
jgi:Insertion element 4 transposase N-terminal